MKFALKSKHRVNIYNIHIKKQKSQDKRRVEGPYISVPHHASSAV